MLFKGIVCEKAILNDKYTFKWLKALKEYKGDWEFVEDYPITRDKFDKWRNAPDSYERTISECFLVYNGLSWGMCNGANISHLNANKHSKQHTIERLRTAHELLQNVTLWSRDWEECLDSMRLNKNDVIYIDPPYITGGSVTLNIDHKNLLKRIKQLKCNVFISTYPHKLYKKELKDWKYYEKIKVSTGKCRGGAHGKSVRKVELLYKN
jgi:site-specific DNA-adenine methylase